MTSWTQAYPLSTTKVKDFPSGQQDNNLALQDALGREHTFAGVYGTTAGNHLPGRCGVIYYGTTIEIAALVSPPTYALAYDTDKKQLQYYNGSAWTATGMMDGTTAQTIAGIKTFSNTPVLPVAAPTADAQAANKKYCDDQILAAVAFASGTKMLFYQDTAPTSWTIDATVNDKTIYISKGTAAGGHTAGMANTYIYTEFDNGTSMSDVEVGDTFEAAGAEGWTTTVKAIALTQEDPGDQEGGLWMSLDGGAIDEDDTAKVTARGATCDIDFAAGYLRAGTFDIPAGSHTHTGPSHTHDLQNSVSAKSSNSDEGEYLTVKDGYPRVIDSNGGNVYRMTSTTTAGGTGATAAPAAGLTMGWRPDAYVCIICTKD